VAEGSRDETTELAEHAIACRRRHFCGPSGGIERVGHGGGVHGQRADVGAAPDL
jgi:hypothetical protein